MIIRLIVIAVLAIYFANVISCAVLCEVLESCEMAKTYIFIMPLIVAGIFFYYIVEGGDRHSRFKEIQSFLRIPAKNMLMVECFARICKERKRKVVVRAKHDVTIIPQISFFAEFFEGNKKYGYYL